MNLAAFLLRAADHAPASDALRCRGWSTTYGELAERSARVAGGLAALGVSPGDRVGVVCPNRPEFVLAYLGVLWAGAVAVPVNPGAPAPEAERELLGTGAVVAVTARESMAAAAWGGRGAEGLRVVLVDEDDGGPDWRALLCADPAEMAERATDDLAVLAHTSGTAGPPRAAMLTHGSLVANIEQGRGHPTVRIEPDDSVLAVLPLFHVYGLNVVLGMALASGGRVVLADRFEPRETADLVRREEVTVVPGVPPMFAAWTEAPDLPDDAFGSVRLAVSGAAPLPIAVQEGFHARFGVHLHQGYGLTEASPVVSSSGAEGAPRPGSVGVPLPGVEVRLVDADGEDGLVGDPGEVWVRGPNIFAGYWEDPEATARVLTGDGWLRTGDVAVADDDGFLYLVDRSKDLIIVSGFNVYPAEVEDVLLAHPGVAEAAVVGVPHPETGEAVKAYVVLRPEVAVSEDELVAHGEAQLARYKCPTSIELVDAIPRGLAGKILRRALQAPRA